MAILWTLLLIAPWVVGVSIWAITLGALIIAFAKKDESLRQNVNSFKDK
jgi:hypothetical protein